jgi:hypothetical protein
LKAKLLVTLATAAVLGIATVACSSLKGVEEKETALAPAPAPAIEPEAGKVIKSTSGNTTTYSGILRGADDSNKFDIVTNNNKAEVEFDWPGKASFYVKVFSPLGDELGDFDLSEGEVVDLTGGGKFTLIVYSKKGGGAWTAKYTE